MSRGIIYIMTSVVPGLIKIGRTGSDNFDQRMRKLESDGYRNVTGMKKNFAIEVDNYEDKEALLHNIFEKSRVADTELFAVDVNLAVQLLSSFDGTIVYPRTETREEIFEDATDSSNSYNLPNGTYTFSRSKRSENNKQVTVKATINSGKWTILKKSIIGMIEDSGVSSKARELRSRLHFNENGLILEDTELGVVAPSSIGAAIFNGSCNGWKYWLDSQNQKIEIYRQTNNNDNSDDE